MHSRIEFGDVAVIVVPCFRDRIFDTCSRGCPDFRAGSRTDLVPVARYVDLGPRCRLLQAEADIMIL
jgi:hypothetical protein